MLIRRPAATAAACAALIVVAGCSAPARDTPATPASQLAAGPEAAGASVDVSEMAETTSPLFAHASYASSAHAQPSRGGVRLATGPGPLAGRTIVVDAGHNGIYRARILTKRVPAGHGTTKACNTSGTASVLKQSEHAHNWSVAVRLAAILKSRGALVVMTRPDDSGVGPCVNERAAIGNRAKADAVVSVHADGAAAGARGFHLIVSTTMNGGAVAEARSRQFASLARAEVGRTGMPRSTYLGKGTAITPRTDIAGLNLSTAPAIMLEAGNMRNRRDAALLASPAYRAKEAAALARAAERFLLG